MKLEEMEQAIWEDIEKLGVRDNAGRIVGLVGVLRQACQYLQAEQRGELTDWQKVYLSQAIRRAKWGLFFDSILSIILTFESPENMPAEKEKVEARKKMASFINIEKEIQELENQKGQ